MENPQFRLIIIHVLLVHEKQIGGILDLSICEPQEQRDLSGNTDKSGDADEQCDMDQGSTLPSRGVEIELLSHRQHDSGPSIMNQDCECIFLN